MEHCTDNEAQLIQSATAGDSRALWNLLSAYRQRLISYLEKHFPPNLRPELEPQDLLQDVYFQAIRNIGQFQPQGHDSVFRWLVTIARNLITDALRRQQAGKRSESKRLALGNDDRSAISMLEELAIYKRTPSRSAMGHELIAALEETLLRLPQDYQTVLRHRFMDGLDVAQTAQRMRRGASTIPMLCQRALHAWRTQLQTQSLYA